MAADLLFLKKTLAARKSTLLKIDFATFIVSKVVDLFVSV